MKRSGPVAESKPPPVDRKHAVTPLRPVPAPCLPDAARGARDRSRLFFSLHIPSASLFFRSSLSEWLPLGAGRTPRSATTSSEFGLRRPSSPVRCDDGFWSRLAFAGWSPSPNREAEPTDPPRIGDVIRRALLL